MKAIADSLLPPPAGEAMLPRSALERDLLGIDGAARRRAALARLADLERAVRAAAAVGQTREHYARSQRALAMLTAARVVLEQLPFNPAEGSGPLSAILPSLD